MFKAAYLRRSILSLVLLSLTGCAPAVLGKRFSNEYDCDDYETKRLGGAAFRVKGCGHVATYACFETGCVKESEKEYSTGTEQSEKSVAAARPAPERADESTSARLRRGKNEDGLVLVELALTSAGWGRVTLTAAPLHESPAARMQIALARPCAACEPKAAVDGELIAIVQQAETMGPKTLTFMVPLSAIASMSKSRRAVLRTGETQWDLNDSDKKALNDFLMAIREEQVLAGQPTDENAKPTGNSTL